MTTTNPSGDERVGVTEVADLALDWASEKAAALAVPR
jgi:hypothetical protein